MPNQGTKPDEAAKPNEATKAKPIHYNKNVEEFAQSGKVEESAREAKRALDDENEAIDLQKAETKGRSPANRPGTLNKKGNTN